MSQHVTRIVDVREVNALFLDVWMPRAGKVAGPWEGGRTLRWIHVVDSTPHMWTCSCLCAGVHATSMVARAAAFAHRMSHQ